MTGGARIGVDIGGTFTDIVLALADGTVRVSKTSSTPHDPGAAVVSGVAELLRAAAVPPASVVEVVHGTTVASNTILQRTGRGRPARPTRSLLTAGGETRAMPGKFAHRLWRDEVITHEQAGGGGFGDLLARDPEAVAVHVWNEKITPGFAEREHAVVLDPRTLKVDADATRQCRARRLARAAPESGAQDAGEA